MNWSEENTPVHQGELFRFSSVGITGTLSRTPHAGNWIFQFAGGKWHFLGNTFTEAEAKKEAERIFFASLADPDAASES